MSVDEARQQLNQVLMDLQMKADMQEFQCASQRETHETMSESSRQSIDDYSFQAATARAKVLEAQTGVSALKDKLPRLRESLKLHESKCTEDTSTQKEQIDLVTKDVVTLGQAAAQTQCGINLPVSLIQCVQHTGMRKRSNATLAFEHPKLRQTVAQLRSPEAKKELQKALSQVVGGSTSKPHRHHHRRKRRSKSHRHRRIMTAGAGVASETVPMPSFLQSGAQAEDQRLCESTTPSCDMLQDKFFAMRTSITDKAEGMQQALMSLHASCDQSAQNFKVQIQEMEFKLSQQQTAMAQAMQDVIQAEEQSRVLGDTLSNLQKELHQMVEECRENSEQFATEMTSVKNVRQQLYENEAEKPFIQDCQVSEWTPEECSKSCDGGTQNMVRTVVVPASLGADCPPLLSQQPCNQQPCPVDCRLGDWGGWSMCSAQCGGGIMERIRKVEVPSSDGGRPCDSNQESAGCGEGACDVNCELAEWTDWSSCSRACGSGFQMRYRHVLTEAKNSGTCAEEESPARQQYQRCNQHTCQPTQGDTLRCIAKLDLVLILDGSGSIGEAGWEATKRLGVSLVSAFSMGEEAAQIAVLVMSGPTDWAQYEKCTQGGQSVDLLQDCKLVWMSHFSTETATLVDEITRLNWPKGSSLASVALGLTGVELQRGRTSASSVVIAITDGKATNPRRTTSAAKALREQHARLLFVPITSEACVSDIESWASKPIADNVLAVSDYNNLDEVANINRIISAACPQVE